MKFILTKVRTIHDMTPSYTTMTWKKINIAKYENLEPLELTSVELQAAVKIITGSKSLHTQREIITELCLFSELVTELCLLAPKRTELCLCVLFARSYVSELSAVGVSRSCVFLVFLHGVVSFAQKYTELCLVPEHGVVSSRRKKHGVVSCSGARSCVFAKSTELCLVQVHGVVSHDSIAQPVEGFWRW